MTIRTTVSISATDAAWLSLTPPVDERAMPSSTSCHTKVRPTASAMANRGRDDQ
jgi:hypothetical protein